MAPLFGTGLGGGLLGATFDVTGSGRSGGATELAWNPVNLTNTPWRLLRSGRRLAAA